MLASTSGKYRPNPDGVISILLNADRGAAASSCASSGRNETPINWTERRYILRQVTATEALSSSKEKVGQVDGSHALSGANGL